MALYGDTDERGRAHLREIYRAGVDAVDPRRLIAGAVGQTPSGIVVGDVEIAGEAVVVGAGKAAPGMVRGIEDACGDRLAPCGVVVAPLTRARTKRPIHVLPGGHPLPNRAGERSTWELMKRITAASAHSHIICLISGGASSLLVAPLPPVRLADKRLVGEMLIRSGADIGEINVVRKHLSAVKGGRLLRLAAARRVTTLILSDVVGDDPSTVGSGPSVADDSTWTDSRRVLEKYRLIDELPASVRELLRRGEAGEVADTVRAGSPEAEHARWFVIGSNRTAIAGAAARARALGYEVEIDPTPLAGDTVAASLRWAQALRRAPAGRRRCVVSGGETTVAVRGSGRGGRNQHFALALSREIEDSGWAVLSAGTDGIDGPTDAAGAFVTGSSARRARKRGIDPREFLENDDSYSFFEKLGDLFITGASGTNALDLKIALSQPASGE